MPVDINISDEDIAYSEAVLLPIGKTFDEERRIFIKNFETIDLQAVPGSGKTTALLAKLVILERKLPFSNGSGVLVLSHTNAAVDEIKDKIQKHCPKLFSYPSFIGTIQGFVDEFLAKPYYIQCNKKKLFRIDNEIYFEGLEYKLSYCLRGQERETFNKILHIKNANDSLLKDFRFGFDEMQNPILLSKINGSELTISKPKGNTRPENYHDYSDEEKQKVRDYLTQLKTELIVDGRLCFDDAYFLANRYLQKFPKVKSIIQKRFSFVFVDEMQDMDNHQYQLLEGLFFDGGNSASKYQRIGDKNQAIFNGDSKIQDLWIDRGNKLEFNGSHRLSENIANVVQPFALQPINIIGLAKNADGSDITIPPYIILYDDHSQENLISKFAEMIKEYKQNNQIPDEANNKYCVIAWNAKPDETVGKMRLPDYYPEYSSEEAKKFIDYSTLESYLNFYDVDSKSLYSIRRNILNAFIKILRLEKLFDKNSKDGQRDRIFTKRNLLKYFREEKNDFYNQFKLLIFKWSFATIKGNKEKVINEIRVFIPTFLSKFERANSAFDNKIDLSKDFIDNPCPSSTEITEENPNPEKRNLITYEDIGEIQVGTVHSVKGQTHTATLYLETSYYSDGGKSYESQRLSEQFKSNNLKGTEGERVKQSAKMAYVGFSRPTHLLCLGIHKERYEKFLKESLPDTWKVIDC